MTRLSLSRYELETRLIKHVLEDSTFRQEFETNPKSCFEKYLNVSAESLPEIRLHHEPAGEWHIVLPAKPANTAELTDAELEQVAGGGTPLVIVSAVVSNLVTPSVGISAAVTEDQGW